jgi:hypothetical protein
MLGAVYWFIGRTSPRGAQTERGPMAGRCGFGNVTRLTG